ncbi:MAG: mandelate racemase [Burkholderiaceae bacterium]|nr:mandelate racemase [Burkholderiaceae bacterium]
MRIEKVEIFSVSIPLITPYKLSRVYGTVTGANAIVVAISTDTGLVGYGEADPMPPFTSDTVQGTIEALRDRLAPAMIGADPREHKKNEETMDACAEGCLMAKGALDMAMYDLAGKAYGVPVHALIGGRKRDTILLSFPLGSGTAREDFEVIDARYALGFRSFMAKMGRNPIADEIERVHALGDRYSGKIQIVADANQGWTEEQAVEFVRGAKGSIVGMLEQPVPANQFEALRRIRAASAIPISADESVVTAQDALRLACLDAVDILSIKASKNGGITKSLRVIAVAETAGMQCRMNSMIECGVTQAALLQLGAVTQTLIPSGHAYMSTLRLADDFTDFASLVHDGYAHVSDAPGLGVTVDSEKLVRHASEAFVVT